MKLFATLAFLLVVKAAFISGRSCQYRSTPANAYKWCSNSNPNSAFSICLFKCKPGYRLQGLTLVQCNQQGSWSSDFPTCVPELSCPAAPERPSNGWTFCTHGLSSRSVCQFRCAPGHKLTGPRYTVCWNGRWTHDSPVCKPQVSECEAQLQEPQHGSIECDGNAVGDSCRFTCDDGYVLEGEASSVCQRTSSGFDWSNEAPTCKSDLTCDSLPMTANGSPSCSDGTNLGSICHFLCDEEFFLEEPVITTCVKTGDNQAEWDLHAPSCLPRGPEPCADLGEIEEGFAIPSTTENGNQVVNYFCNEFYQLRPSYASTLQCSDDGMWNGTRPCCAEQIQCDQTRAADIVIGIDSSISFGEENFFLVKEFVRDYIDSFTLQEDLTRFSVFQYNSAVDTDSEILLDDSVVDRQELINAFANLPNTLDEGHSTGLALTHINDVILQETNGDRPNVNNYVFLFTGPSSEDNVHIPANQLRTKERTEVFVVGFNAASKLDLRHFVNIAGDMENAVEVDEDVNEAAFTAFEKIEKSVCRVEC